MTGRSVHVSDGSRERWTSPREPSTRTYGHPLFQQGVGGPDRVLRGR